MIQIQRKRISSQAQPFLFRVVRSASLNSLCCRDSEWGRPEGGAPQLLPEVLPGLVGHQVSSPAVGDLVGDDLGDRQPDRGRDSLMQNTHTYTHTHTRTHECKGFDSKLNTAAGDRVFLRVCVSRDHREGVWSYVG